MSATCVLPDKAAFSSVYDQNQAQCVWASIPADVHTPVAIALRLEKQEDYLCLLESVEKGQNRSRYSCIALRPDIVWSCQNGGEITLSGEHASHYMSVCEHDNPMESLKALHDGVMMKLPPHLPAMASGLFGYMGYDMVRYMERLPDKNPDPLQIPEGIFFRAQIVIVFDAVKDEMTIVTPVEYQVGCSADEAYGFAKQRIDDVIDVVMRPLEESDVSSLCFASTKPMLDEEKICSNRTKEEFCSAIEKAKEYIVAGDVFQVVLSQRFAMSYTYSAFELYRELRHLNPSPYSFYVKMGEFSLVGSSPEILVRVENGQMVVRPIAGTRWRGETEQEDVELAQDLMQDEKELAEHLMLLDLGRNDVGRVAEVGSVQVVEKMVIDYYSHVMHIVSKVQGLLKSGCSVVDALKAGFPAGTVSGAPKIRAMEIIDELETERRSFYAGGVGYFSANGDMDTCIALRTGLVKDGMFYVQAGGGVVADSQPEYEYEESQNKAKALLLAAQIVNDRHKA
jgi:anthranilate synthase component 1